MKSNKNQHEVNRDSIIINFFRTNLKLLQQNEFPDDLYKIKKTQYFVEQHKKQIGKPEDSEIAEVGLFYLIKKNNIRSIEELERILGRPFFQKNIDDAEIFLKELDIKLGGSSLEIDPSRLDNQEYREAVLNQMKQEMVKENQEEFQEQKIRYEQELQDSKNELAKIPSFLQDEDFEEPGVKQDEISYKQEWWEQLNLRSDPFPKRDGLLKIDPRMYEDIIVHTNVFNNYIAYSKNQREQLFKNTIFYGDYGSGKTAFFDYFREILLRSKILVIRIDLWPMLDGDTNIKNFIAELSQRIEQECRNLNVNVHYSKEIYDPIVTVNLLKNLKEQRGFTEAIIIVDDLHKRKDAFDAILEFISYLQIFTSNLMRDTSMNIALYIAGIPEWKERISSNRVLSGSLVRNVDMPEVSESNAYEMLNKRLIAYSKNPDRREIIEPSFVKQIYRELKEYNQPITFREFISKSVDELERGNFDILTVNPNNIPQENLQGIKKLIYNNDILNILFTNLMKRGKDWKTENLQRCLHLLVVMYLDKGIRYDSEQAKRNAWALQQLYRIGFLDYSSSKDKSVRWHVKKDLLELNKFVIGRYGLSMEDYLIPIFLGEKMQHLETKDKALENNSIASLLNDLHDPIEKQLVTDVITTHDKLVEIRRKHDISLDPNELVRLCIRPLARLTRLYLKIGNINESLKKDIEILQFWNRWWFKPPTLLELINQLSTDYNKTSNYIFGLYPDAFEELSEFIKKDIEKTKIFTIDLNGLTPTDSENISVSRKLWSEREYYKAAEDLAEHVENKLRISLFNIFTILYGPRERREKRIDKETRRRMKENEDKDRNKGLSVANNEMQNLDRKDYKNVMTQQTDIGRSNWNEIFEYIFYPSTHDTILEYLNIFADFNTPTSHGKTEAITSSTQNKLFRFILESIPFMKSLNESYRLLFQSIYRKDRDYFFSFHSFRDQSNLFPIQPTLKDAEHILEGISKNKEILFKFDNIPYMEQIFNTEYRTLYAVLSMVMKSSTNQSNNLGWQVSILEDRSPEFLFMVKQISKDHNSEQY